MPLSARRRANFTKKVAMAAEVNGMKMYVPAKLAVDQMHANMATGVVKAVGPAIGTVTISHQAMPAITVTCHDDGVQGKRGADRRHQARRHGGLRIPGRGNVGHHHETVDGQVGVRSSQSF